NTAKVPRAEEDQGCGEVRPQPRHFLTRQRIRDQVENCPEPDKQQKRDMRQITGAVTVIRERFEVKRVYWLFACIRGRAGIHLFIVSYRVKLTIRGFDHV